MRNKHYLIRRNAWDRFLFLIPLVFAPWSVAAYSAYLAITYHDPISVILYLMVIVPLAASGFLFFNLRNGDYLEVDGSSITYHVLFQRNTHFLITDIKTIWIERNYAATNGETIRYIFTPAFRSADPYIYCGIVLQNGTVIRIPDEHTHMDLLISDFLALHPEQKEQIKKRMRVHCGQKR